MLKNYFKLAVRHFANHPGYTAIRILCLSLGMACFLLIMLFVNTEYSANRQFSGKDQIYLIRSIWHEHDNLERFLSFSPLAAAMRNEIAGVKNAMRYTAVDADFLVDNQPFRSPTLIADPQLLEIFDFAFLHGDPATALTNPNSIILTQDEAIRFFGRTDIIGETVRINGWGDAGARDFHVAGVLEKQQYNSVTFIGRTEQHSIISFDNASMFFSDAAFDSDWGIYNTVTFIELDPGIDPDLVSARLPLLLETNLPEHLSERVSVFMEPLASVYLNENNGSVRKLIGLLTILAILILCIACFNFVNISLSLATARSKEVGVRKVLGAAKKQLIGQFIGEAVLICCLAMGLALLISYIALPSFNSLVGRDLVLDIGSPLLWLLIASITGIAGGLSGAYPAFIMTAISPIRALKELLKTGQTALQIRRVLVVTQFVVAAGLIICSIFITQQTAYIADMDPGFDRDQLVVISSLPRTWTEEGVRQLDTIKQRIIEIPGVQSASVAWGPPGPRYTGLSMEFRKEGDSITESRSLPISKVDADFLQTTGIELAEGAFFDHRWPSAEQLVVINEAAARAFGFTQPIGHVLQVGETNYRILGVVSDYHTASLDLPIGPLALLDVRQLPQYRELLVRYDAVSTPDILNRMTEAWEEVYPGLVFDSYFVEDQWNDMHRWIAQTREITQVSASLAILIALLGLLGLVSIGVRQRVREMGIRKILGASAVQLVGLLSREYIGLVFVAFSIAAPIAFIVTTRWLEGFANRIDPSPAIYLITGIIMLIAAIVTVSIHAVRAASVNPADTLRHE